MGIWALCIFKSNNNACQIDFIILEIFFKSSIHRARKRIGEIYKNGIIYNFKDFQIMFLPTLVYTLNDM